MAARAPALLEGGGMATFRKMALIGLLFLTGCTEAALGDFKKHFAVDSRVTGPVVIGRKQIPLPDGDWVVAARDTSYSKLSTPQVALVLVNRNPSDPAFGIAIYTNVVSTQSTTGWTPLSTCTRKDVLSPSPSYSEKGGGEECWFINHQIMTRTSRASKLQADALDYMHAHHMRLPNTTVYTGYRIADERDYLTVRYHFNPEAEGFVPDQGGGWRTSDWHRDRIDRDPRRVAYIDARKKWSADWLRKVRAGFRGNLAKPGP